MEWDEIKGQIVLHEVKKERENKEKTKEKRRNSSNRLDLEDSLRLWWSHLG